MWAVAVAAVLLSGGCVTSRADSANIYAQWILAGNEGAHVNAQFPSGDKTANPLYAGEVVRGERTEASAAWWGFDPGDATAFLQEAIFSGAEVLYIPNMGSPWVVTPIYLASNQKIVIENGTVIQAKRGAFRNISDSLLNLHDVENVDIYGYGAHVRMWKEDYLGRDYERGEWRHTIYIRDAQNISIRGLQVSSSGGDGLYVGRGRRVISSRDILIQDVLFDDHLRQGISVVSAVNMRVENCVAVNTAGVFPLPQAGIDLEPNRADEELVNITIDNCLLGNNVGDGVLLGLQNLTAESTPIQVTVSENTIRDNGGRAIRIYGADKKINGHIRLIDNRGDGATAKSLARWQSDTLRITDETR